jgi:hypothetical protein
MGCSCCCSSLDQVVKHKLLSVASAARQSAVGPDSGLLLWCFVLCPSHSLAQSGACVCYQDMLTCMFPTSPNFAILVLYRGGLCRLLPPHAGSPGSAQPTERVKQMHQRSSRCAATYFSCTGFARMCRHHSHEQFLLQIISYDATFSHHMISYSHP